MFEDFSPALFLLYGLAPGTRHAVALLPRRWCTHSSGVGSSHAGSGGQLQQRGGGGAQGQGVVPAPPASWGKTGQELRRAAAHIPYLHVRPRWPSRFSQPPSLSQFCPFQASLKCTMRFQDPPCLQPLSGTSLSAPFLFPCREGTWARETTAAQHRRGRSPQTISRFYNSS